MRLLFCLAALALTLSGQTPIAAPPPPAPASAPPKPNDVLFEVNGKAWTRNDWDTFADSLPEGTQGTLRSNPAEFVQQLATIDYLTNKAMQEGFLDKEPYKTRWALERLKLISTFYQEHMQNFTGATDEEVKAFYDRNKDRFTTVTLKMLYLSPPAAGSDMAILAKAEDLYRQAAQGADFVKLVRDHSEEPGSKGRDGDFGTLSKSDPVPDEVKAVVFNLKKGEVTKPIRVSNGIYIFRCEDAKTVKLDEVMETLRTELRQKKYMDWFASMTKQANVKWLRKDYVTK